MAFIDLFKTNELRETISRLEKERDKLLQENQGLTASIARKNSEFERTVAGLKKQNNHAVDQLKTTLRGRDERISSLQSTIDELQKKIEMMQEELTQLVEKQQPQTLALLKESKKEIIDEESEYIQSLFRQQLGSVARYGKPSLKSFKYTTHKNGVTLDYYVGKEKDVVIPERIDGIPVVKIGTSAFEKCGHVESVYIPSTVKTIEYNAFDGAGISSVILCEGLETIESDAFSRTENLKQITIPNTVKTISEDCFYESGLERVVIKGAKKIESHSFFGCRKLKIVVLPDELKTVARGAFSVTNIKRIVFPKSVKEIDFLDISGGLGSDAHVAILGEKTDLEVSDRSYSKPTVYCNIDSKAYIAARLAGYVVKPLEEFPADDELDNNEQTYDGNGYNRESTSSSGDGESNGELDTSTWNLESILHQEGYTVAQKENLSDYERQHILKSVINRNLMSKWQIIEHIELQISLRRNNRMYNIAVSKWERDLAFLRSI